MKIRIKKSSNEGYYMLCTLCKREIRNCVICDKPLPDLLLLAGVRFCSEACLIQIHIEWYKHSYKFTPRNTACSQPCHDRTIGAKYSIRQVKKECEKRSNFVCHMSKDGTNSNCSKHFGCWPRVFPFKKKEDQMDPDMYVYTCVRHSRFVMTEYEKQPKGDLKHTGRE